MSANQLQHGNLIVIFIYNIKFYFAESFENDEFRHATG